MYVAITYLLSFSLRSSDVSFTGLASRETKRLSKTNTATYTLFMARTGIRVTLQCVNQIWKVKILILSRLFIIV